MEETSILKFYAEDLKEDKLYRLTNLIDYLERCYPSLRFGRGKTNLTIDNEFRSEILKFSETLCWQLIEKFDGNEILINGKYNVGKSTIEFYFPQSYGIKKFLDKSSIPKTKFLKEKVVYTKIHNKEIIAGHIVNKMFFVPQIHIKDIIWPKKEDLEKDFIEIGHQKFPIVRVKELTTQSPSKELILIINDKACVINSLSSEEKLSRENIPIRDVQVPELFGVVRDDLGKIYPCLNLPFIMEQYNADRLSTLSV